MRLAFTMYVLLYSIVDTVNHVIYSMIRDFFEEAAYGGVLFWARYPAKFRYVSTFLVTASARYRHQRCRHVNERRLMKNRLLRNCRGCYSKHKCYRDTKKKKMIKNRYEFFFFLSYSR